MGHPHMTRVAVQLLHTQDVEEEDQIYMCSTLDTQNN